MKKSSLIICAVLLASTTLAQEPEKESGISFTGGADFVSSYVWRGVVLNSSPDVQPYLNFNAGNFSAGFWTSQSFDGKFKEFDLSASYKIGQFKVLVTDYFSNTNSVEEPVEWSQWDNDSTSHALEASLNWNSDFGLDASFNILFYGADKKYDDNGESENAYSTYFEAGYTKTVNEIDIRPYVGLTFSKTAWYGDCSATHGFNLVNLGVKASYELPLKEKISMPISVNFGYNPQSDDVAAFVGVGVAF